jgi:hypothetical protein
MSLFQTTHRVLLSVLSFLLAYLSVRFSRLAAASEAEAQATKERRKRGLRLTDVLTRFYTAWSERLQPRSFAEPTLS